MKHVFAVLLIFVFSLAIAIVNPGHSRGLSGSDFHADDIIGDSIFFATGTLSANDIQTFLNSKVPACDTNGAVDHGGGQTRAQWAATTTTTNDDPPYTCLKDYTDSTIGWPAETGLCNAISAGTRSAAQIIDVVSNACGINPQVLIVLLQKEQGLVTDDWPWDSQYQFATGFCVFDTGSTPPDCAGTQGFFGQVYYAARQFKKYGRSPSSYSYRAFANNYVQYNPDANCGGSTVYIQNQATANLYNYTPYQPNSGSLAGLNDSTPGGTASCGAYGNRNFWWYFNTWFGATHGPADYSCKFSSNVAGALTGEHIIPNSLGGRKDNLSMTIPNNTGSKCIEVHTWLNQNYTTWYRATATNSPAMSPADVKILAADTNGDGQDELYKVDYCGSSGMIEIHGWTADDVHWASHTATNRPCISSADAEVIAADPDGDGKDNFFLVEYQHTATGRVQVHEWSSNLQQWVSHIATNYGAIDPRYAQVVAGDPDGDGHDNFFLVNYLGTGGSGHAEVHGWTGDFQNWVSHIATISAPIQHVDPSGKPVSDIITADTNGDGHDEFYQIDYLSTGSQMVEVHGFTSNFQSWFLHSVTNEGEYQ